MDSNRESARIYVFPRRPAVAGSVPRNGSRPAADLRPASLPDFGGAWYHQAAVEEAEQTRKR